MLMAESSPLLTVVHLTSSRFYGGPERQMLGLAESSSRRIQSVFISFSENGRCRAFVSQCRSKGFDAFRLRYDTPRLFAAAGELRQLLHTQRACILCSHGYKANIVARMVTHGMGIPHVTVSRGWTGESTRVRLYDALDKRILRYVDRVVCVSRSQADQVHSMGVPATKTRVIYNAIQSDRFARPNPSYGKRLRRLFPFSPMFIIGAAGRLSKEKGHAVLVTAASLVEKRYSQVGIVIFGEGRLRKALQNQIDRLGMTQSVIIPGHRPDLDGYLPHLDLLVVPSFTEDIPNILLESLAAHVPVVASAVGGIPELIKDGHTGRLVPAGDAEAMAESISQMISDRTAADRMRKNGHQSIQTQFSFACQSRMYESLCDELLNSASRKS